MTDSAFLSRTTCDLQNRSTVTFQIDNTYEIPLALMTSHISQFQSVLTFAAKLLDIEKSVEDEFTRDHLFSEYLKDIQQKHSQDIMALEKRALSESTIMVSPLLQKIDEMRRESDLQIKALQKTNQILQSDILTMKAESETSFLRDVKQLQKRIAELEVDLARSSKSESIIREQCEAESDRRINDIKEHTRELIKLKDETLQQREESIRIKEDELKVKLQRQASSSFRGQDGENYFSTTVKEKMNWDLIHKGKVAHSGDYFSTIYNSLVLFEVKNYTATVPQKEVRKFHNDMKEHPECSVGIFISLNTDIQSHPWASAPIAIDWINGSQCAVYIQSCLDLDIDHTLYTIDQIIRIAIEFNKKTSVQGDESKIDEYKQRIERAKRLLENGILGMSTLIRKIRLDHKKYTDMLEDTTNHTILELKGQTDLIKTSIQALLSDYTDIPDEEDESEKPENSEKSKQTKSPRKTKAQSKN